MNKLYKCSCCKEKKQAFEFYFNKSSSTGLDSYCKLCRKNARKNTHLKHKDVENAKLREKRKNNLESKREYDRLYYKKYKEVSGEKLLSTKAKYRASKRNAVPSWLSLEDKAKIRSLYKLAIKLSKLTGILYHVDHIVPLQGELVSGLHVPWNLQVLPAIENMSKGNKFIDDIVSTL